MSESRRLRLAWHVFAAILLVVAPGQIWLQQPIWRGSSAAVIATLAITVAYPLSVFLLSRVLEGRRPRYRLLWLATSLAPLWGVYFVVMVLAVPYSRGILLIGSLLFILLHTVRLWVGGSLATATVLAGSAAAVIVGLGLAHRPAQGLLASDTNVVATNRHLVKVTQYPDLVESEAGGALSRFGDDALLVTGEGQFFQVSVSGDVAKLEPLSLRAPLNREDFLRANPGIRRRDFRVAGLLVQPVRDRSRVVVSHHYWKDDEECFVLRFSEIVVDDADLRMGGRPNLDRRASWRTLYETRPCLPIKEGVNEPFEGIESGGRVVLLDDTALIVTVGDHAFDGVNSARALAQSTDNDYGKTLIIPLDGRPARIFTLGHRNPQGLLVASTGEIWITEHGPEGGDEVNLLREGANYGWPLKTHGTDYGRLTWPLTDDSPGNPGFEEPWFSWVPSIAVTNLITLETDGFPRWRDDILVGSMRAGGLHRLHREGDRFIYEEPIQVPGRIRDLVELPEGQLVLWADGGSLVILTPGDDPTDVRP